MIYKLLALFFTVLEIQVAISQNTVKIQAGAVFTIKENDLVTFKDMNLDNDGTVNLLPGDGTILFSGSQNNTVGGNNSPLFDKLEIAKTGSGKLSLGRNINIGSSINFTSGLIDLNNNNILMQPNALLIGESESSRITGNNGGYLEISKALNSPSALNAGNLGAIISSPVNMGNTIIRRGHKSQLNGSGIGSSVLRYYDIIPANNSSLIATLRFQYFDAELNGFDENTIVIWKSVDTLTWLKQGFTSRDNVANFVEKTGIPDFSRWTLSSPFNSLPLHFVVFNGNCNGTGVKINWETVNEINIAGFAVERSSDGSTWIVIGTLPPGGSGNTLQSYTYLDPNPLPSGSFYRIAEYDINGHVQYTPVNHIICPVTNEWQVWPNPVSNQLIINITTSTPSIVRLSLSDEKGACIKEQENTLIQGINRIKINVKELPAGIYHLTAEWDNGKTRRSIIVVRQ